MQNQRGQKYNKNRKLCGTAIDSNSYGQFVRNFPSLCQLLCIHADVPIPSVCAFYDNDFETTSGNW